MGINFNALPTQNPYSVPAPGFYRAKITKAEMKTPNDTNKKDYLAVTMALSDAHGRGKGNLFDNFFDSDAGALKYKLGRFYQALKINIPGECELKDLAKIIVGKELVVDITNKENTYNGQTTVKAEVNLFGREAYYPVEQFADLLALDGNVLEDADLDAISDDEVPFNFESDDEDKTEY